MVPVYFEPSVRPDVVRSILQQTFSGHTLFCSADNTLAVVDRGSTAESLFRESGRSSPLFGLPVHVLEENRGKTGAIREGLSELLERTRVPYIVTRDCDGDHLLEDLPRMVSVAEPPEDGVEEPVVSVFGVRPSLAKPMNWLRQEWEVLTNSVVVDLVAFLLARDGRLLDRRYWNGYALDLQSGYRVYSRAAARLALESLQALPDERDIYTMACEIMPFLELSLHGGIVAQVQRGTWVEQPVSSYATLPFSRYYGKLLGFMADRYGLSRRLLRGILDNHLVNSPAYFSAHRQELLECREYLDPVAETLRMPRFL